MMHDFQGCFIATHHEAFVWSNNNCRTLKTRPRIDQLRDCGAAIRSFDAVRLSFNGLSGQSWFRSKISQTEKVNV